MERIGNFELLSIVLYTADQDNHFHICFTSSLDLNGNFTRKFPHFHFHLLELGNGEYVYYNVL